MTKRTILIILGALLFLAIIAVAWWWFFSWSGTQEGPAEGFGSGETRTPGGEGAGEETNIGTALPGAGAGQNTGTASNINLGTVGPSGSGSGGSGVYVPRGATTTTGVTWLPGGGPITSLTLTPTNQLNNGSIGGEVVLFGTPPAPGSVTDLPTALIGAGVGTALCTAGLLPGVIAATGAAAAAVGAPGVPSADIGTRLQNVISIGALTNETIRENFLNCITRTIARAAVQQITASTINWINSGFEGKPSFVQNYQQFFTNVADQAAGTYIQGSALSFLCSPFQLKIKIALAQSYAKRNNAASCTLSRVSSNIQSFMDGNFNAGGWGGLLEFTTTPTNNPFGAYSYAQIGLGTAQAQAQQNAQARISPGGFLSTQEKYDCQPTPGPTQNGQPLPPTCKTRITTPGSTIETTLANTLNVDKQLLVNAGISGSFDAIINALMQQLTIRALQGGLSNLSGVQGYESNFLTPDQKLAQAQGNELLSALQGIANTAGQYGQVAQGAIHDVQNAQERLQELVNCYETKNNNSGAEAAAEEIAELEQQVAFYNARITKANAAIALLQSFQTRVLQVTTLAQVTAIKADLNAAQANGTLIATTDVTSAQQDRTTLQSQLATRNQQTAVDLTQCKAS